MLNEDQATGDSGGQVVPSRAYVPCSHSAARFGNKPCAIYSSTNNGSRPSSPSTTTRRTFRRRLARRPRHQRNVLRIGHVTSANSAVAMAINTARNEPASAIPAPGPM